MSKKEAVAEDSGGPSVGLVVAYYGRLPDNFPIWLRTCAENPTIDWLFFTDLDFSSYTVPPNVHRFDMPFAALKDLFEQRLEMTGISLERPYKICDFRPAFGILFEEWLKDYEFWGHSDLDVVWGNLRKFFPREVLLSHQKIQNGGHLTFYRNSPEVNEFFRQAHPDVDYRKVFTDPGVFAFDEWRGAHQLAYLKGLNQIWIRKYVDADPRSYAIRAIRHPNYRHQIFYWEDGAVFREFVSRKAPDPADTQYPPTEREEFSHAHLQRRPLRVDGFDPYSVRGFYITPTGFIAKTKAEHYLGDFRRLNPQKPLFRLKERLSISVKRLLKG